jgi:hypothetical protein
MHLTRAGDYVILYLLSINIMTPMLKQIEQKKLIKSLDGYEDKKSGIVKSLTSWKAKLIAVLIGLGISIALFLVAFVNISRWYDQNKVTFQTPGVEVHIYWPIVIHDRAVNYVDPRTKVHSPIPEPTEKPSPTPHNKPKEEAKAQKGIVYGAESETGPSDREIAELVASYDWDYNTAIRVAKSENFWNLTKSFDCARTNSNDNGSIDVGLFQINSIHQKRLSSLGMTMEDMKDCKKNAEFAYTWLYSYQGWTPWVSYNNGDYKNHSVIEL